MSPSFSSSVLAGTLFLLFFLQGIFCPRVRPSNFSPCEQSSCYPATGDLLVGRENRLSATSTCGLNGHERYCIVSHLEDQKNKCFYCDSRQPFAHGNTWSHRVENIVSTFKKDWKLRWWQTRNGMQNASLRLDLEAEFHFTHLILRFKTFRPAAMLIERSYDFGKTWKVYRYFAYDCRESFPDIPVTPIRHIQDVICESRYSDVAPSTEGEVIFRVLPASVEIADPYSEEVQDLLKITNLRVNFTKLHTLGDNLLDSRAEIKEKYYYSVYNMVVRGSCSCYGHASRCTPLPGQEDNRNMVHGRCECTHNTKGLNCEQCDDFYNDLPWRPARGRETNACKQCDCNQHSNKCHFDPAVYVATEHLSGGVCDDCQHNTMGYHCEECKPFFFQDPYKDITDLYVCQNCNCDPIGSEHGGECEGRTDEELGLVAGRCICKRNVDGQRCDTCQDGFWNMQANNPDGCEACGCYTLGTIGNYGCDKFTGECQCKRYVVGRQCNQCQPGYWNLNEDAQGCQPCNCDVGGAYDNNCDQSTGQCRCRPNVIGLQCNQPRAGHFVMSLDWQIYEGEYANGIGNVHVINREVTPGRPCTWTGPGFMQVTEGSSLEFIINDIPFSMEYDVIVRYEPQMSQRWADVRLTVIRSEPVDQFGNCANSIPQDDLKPVVLSQASRHYLVAPSMCLEKGKTYTIRIDFNRYLRDRSTPDASVLIDSIVLMPSGTGHPIMQPKDPQNIRIDFERYRCREHQISAISSPISEICKKLIFSSSVSVYDGATDCDCDPVGSESSECETIGGQCRCKPYVMGRRCDKCAPGAYGFGPAGCTECNCHQIGSLDNFCDLQTGQCKCIANAYGQQCGHCQSGFFGFPNCRRCQCSGKSEDCDSDSGQCLGCRDYTGGHHCERCADGYYGDPRPGSAASGCQPCMCPGGEGSGYQHADTCRLDTRSNNVICDCRSGYGGLSCDRCAQNYYGNPLTPGGTCELCSCNNNIDFSTPDSCDSTSGQCLKCQFNTEGDYCERCKTGFYGDATQQNCHMCICNLLGTNRTKWRECHHETGQCHCLPHVSGTQCSQCEPNYWKLASGEGCEECGCDPNGSTQDQCNEFDGQCDCVTGRGGRDCSECEDLFWGDPSSQCIPCNCDAEGSTTLQCDRRTGQCECAVGVTGLKCDRCDRGTTGSLPHCVPCGECYNNWDRIVSDIRNETNLLIELGGEIKVDGAPGAFDSEFNEMEEKINEVRRILNAANMSGESLDDLSDKLVLIRQNLTNSSSVLEDLDLSVEQTTNKIEAVNNRIEEIKLHFDRLKLAAQALRENATKVQEMDVSGAFNSIKDSHNRSEQAQHRVNLTMDTIEESEIIRQQVEQVIAEYENDTRLKENDDMLASLDEQMKNLSASIVDLNGIVCDGAGDPCDSVCGGAGCGICGGAVSCQDGAVSKSISAGDFSRRAETLLKEKQKEADELMTEVKSAKDLCDTAYSEAKAANENAELAKNESESNRADVGQLIEAITEFLQQRGATTPEIKYVVEEVLAMSISLTPDEILDLGKQIIDTIEGLTNIDAILNATRDDVEMVNSLKERADRTKSSADQVLSTAQRIQELLTVAQEAQEAARNSLDESSVNILIIEENLNMTEEHMLEANTESQSTLTKVYDLRERIERIKEKFLENEINVEQATRESNEAEEMAKQAQQNAQELQQKYASVLEQLEAKINETRIAQERVDVVKNRTSDMYQSLLTKVKTLQEWTKEFQAKEEDLSSILDHIRRLDEDMIKLVVDVKAIERYQRTCGTA